MFVHSRQPSVCPDCGQISTSRHSRYRSRLKDLPLQGLSVQMWLSVSHFRCRNDQCMRSIFCERMPGVVRVFARQTTRLAEIHWPCWIHRGRSSGSTSTRSFGNQDSDDTIRRRVTGRRSDSQEEDPIRSLGVDDWARRKQQSYGTVLVDLERRRVADLLPDRSAESLSLWLAGHPTMQVTMRDRCGLYAQGASEGAPFAIQVADRFPLVLNLSGAIERVLEERSEQHCCALRTSPRELHTIIVVFFRLTRPQIPT